MAQAGNPVLDDDYIEALRRKYCEERDRRVRPEGESQYLAVTGKYAEFVDTDPFAPVTPREPLHDEVEIAIVGGGWSGMVTAARLVEAGVADFRLIDDAADFGGTWYWNRYPGIQCDIESYSYLPLLEETGYIPKEKYSYGAEIAEHARRIGERYGLYDKVVFQTRVTEIRWDNAAKRWILSTNRGDTMRAHYVVLASGLASRPKLPGIPGFDDFEGKVFHTCRWDYDYTGGDVNGGMTKLADKRVAIIGTGATAIQCVPFVGESAERLYVFQRTPSSVDLRGNAPTDPDFAKSLEPGWQQRRRENFNNVLMGVPVEEDLVNDRWTVRRRLVERLMAQGIKPDMETLMREADKEDFVHMEEIRRRCEEEVKDPETAELLKPYYQRICKRPTFNDQYLATFNRPNVELVDTSWSHGVERITKNGLIANGKEYEVDCIILATGFEMSTGFKRRIGVEVLGRDGLSLYDHWGEGMRTMRPYCWTPSSPVMAPPPGSSRFGLADEPDGLFDVSVTVRTW